MRALQCSTSADSSTALLRHRAAQSPSTHRVSKRHRNHEHGFVITANTQTRGALCSVGQKQHNTVTSKQRAARAALLTPVFYLRQMPAGSQKERGRSLPRQGLFAQLPPSTVAAVSTHESGRKRHPSLTARPHTDPHSSHTCTTSAHCYQLSLHSRAPAQQDGSSHTSLIEQIPLQTPHVSRRAGKGQPLFAAVMLKGAWIPIHHTQ